MECVKLVEVTHRLTLVSVLSLYKVTISLNLKKCIFCVPFGILLGHVACKKGLLMDLPNIVVIFDLQPPTLVRQLRETLGHIGYYRKFIKGYTNITTPVEKLLMNEAKF
jgi:hypothetical protein